MGDMYDLYMDYTMKGGRSNTVEGMFSEDFYEDTEDEEEIFHTPSCRSNCCDTSMAVLITSFGSVAGVNLSGVVDACIKDDGQFPEKFMKIWENKGITPTKDGYILVKFVGSPGVYTYPLHYTSKLYNSFV